jgi:predicted metal-dependent phosphotriesterase family hydrolase
VGMVETVSGPVNGSQLGVTLPHEHVFINSMLEERATGLLNDFDLMKQEVSRFVTAGGRTLVDVTTAELTSGASPDPTGRYSGVRSTGNAEYGTREINNIGVLARLAAETDLHIVLGTGHYRDPFLDPNWFDRTGVHGITAQIVADLTIGIGDSGVKAGIIGEIGADKWYLSAAEERSFRAAGRAQQATGVAVTTHAARWPIGIDQLDVLVAEGADPRRVIIGHCDTVNIPEYHEEIARRGAFVQFDTIRGITQHDTDRRVSLVLNLARKKLLSQLLLSQDICSRSHLHISGGGGYDFLPTHFVEELRRAGLSDDDVQVMLVDNPRRALCG